MKRAHYFLTSLLFILVIMSTASSCGVKRYVPENEVLYQGSKLNVSSDSTIRDIHKIEEELEALLRPEPNSKILGIKLGLWSYYKTRQKKSGFLSKYLNKKIGEEPVYLSDADPERTQELIRNRLENRGFFESEISTRSKQRKTAGTITYDIDVKTPYTVERYQLEHDSLAIYSEIQSRLSNSFIKPQIRFDLARFKLERERIDKHLKSKGYYNFNADFLIFEADTNQYKGKKFDLYLRLKNDIPTRAKIPYIIHSVTVYPNHAIDNKNRKLDTVSISGIDYLQDSTFFKPKKLAPYILFNKGELYNPTTSKLTSNRLSSIGTYKFVNIQFDERKLKDNVDSIGLLDAKIYLSPLNKRALRAELQAVTKSNNFTGPALSLTYSNRNLFKGGETLNIIGKIGYETQVASGDNAGLSSTQIGLKTNLIFPRLLFPIRLVDRFKYAIPKTKISTGVEYLNRSKLYSLNSFTGSFGYNWNANKYVYHELNPISINYIKLANTTEEFEKILDENPFLNSSFEQQFIAGLTYSFIYSELNSSSKKNLLFFNTNVDVAGNTLSLLSNTSDKKNTFLGQEYAQFSKIDADIRYYFNLGKNQTLITRLFGGVGLAYGNSNTLPFSKQYFSGGPYSIRAFRTRSIGPGTYNPEATDTGAFFDRSGDIRLEANVEYRFPVYSFLNGAFFFDAGNVWLFDENETLPGGKFTSSFTKELAMGTGFGLRLDIQGFVIRLDWGIPIHTPRIENNQEYTFDIPNGILNFAIGYPF